MKRFLEIVFIFSLILISISLLFFISPDKHHYKEITKMMDERYAEPNGFDVEYPEYKNVTFTEIDKNTSKLNGVLTEDGVKKEFEVRIESDENGSWYELEVFAKPVVVNK